MDDIYNAHTHIFTGNCAPKDFLQVGLKMGDGGSKIIKWLFLTKPVSWLIEKMGGVIPNKQLQFLKIGVMASQGEVLKNLLNSYSQSEFSHIKIVSLSIDMDYMTDSQNKPSQDFNSQIQEVVKLKKAYPSTLFPFYGIDPRNPETLHISKLKTYIQSGTFAGIKLYPAKGFFPFDPRLNAMYRFACENNVPVMTHCTRSGSYFIGKNVWSAIPDVPPSLNPQHSVMENVKSRINSYKTNGGKEFKSNSRVCNLFSHPQNYLPVLDMYPNLKLCLAHLGGVTEILGDDNTIAKDKKLYNDFIKIENGASSWYAIIRDNILKNYPNTFSDISYSLSDKDAMEKIYLDLKTAKLPPSRILFGTDYFMVQQEDSELNVIAVAQEKLKDYLPKMMSDNIKRYLY